MEMIIIVAFVPSNAFTTIGISIPKVPHEVPVANARNHAMINTSAGRKLSNASGVLFTSSATNYFAPRLSVIAFNVQANVRIKIAGTIALNPSGIQDMDSLNFNTRRNI